MSYKKLRKAIDGICAYDLGATCAGIRDEELRTKIIAHFNSLSNDEHRQLLAKLTVDLWLKPSVVSQGYGPEDARDFLNWCDDQGILVR